MEGFPWLWAFFPHRMQPARPRLEVLGKTANDAVSAICGDYDTQNDEDDQDEDCEDDEDGSDDEGHIYEEQPDINDANEHINTLRRQISLWRIPDAPHQ